MRSLGCFGSRSQLCKFTISLIGMDCHVGPSGLLAKTGWRVVPQRRCIASAICNDRAKSHHPSAVFARSEATWQSIALTIIEWCYGLPRRPTASSQRRDEERCLNGAASRLPEEMFKKEPPLLRRLCEERSDVAIQSILGVQTTARLPLTPPFPNPVSLWPVRPARPERLGFRAGSNPPT